MRKRSVGGFTLIEILIVLFIISIVTSMAFLSISRNENRQLESFANELTQMLTLAEEQAMLEPSVLGLSINEHSLQFASFETLAEEKKKVWIPLKDKLLGQHRIPKGVELAVQVGEKRAEGEADKVDPTHPQIIISTNGDITPFTIYVGKPGEKPRYVIKGHADGSVTNTLLS